MKTLPLDGIWSVRPDRIDCIGPAGLESVLSARDGWMEALVPGEIHLDLMRAGRMDEPSVGRNMPECRWPETHSWWYRTSFEIDEGLLGHERVQLVFDGLDLYAQVFLNERLVGESRDSLVPAVFDVSLRLRVGRNDLVVRLTSGGELAPDDTIPGQNQPQRHSSAAAGGAVPNPQTGDDLYGHRGWHGNKWLRKAKYMYGWDWVEALPNIGIWRGVRLEARRGSVLAELRLDTRILSGAVFLEMEAVVENLHAYAERSCTFELEVRAPDTTLAVHRRIPLDLVPGRTAVVENLPVPDARLWWPFGYGDQPLYSVEATVTDSDGVVCDRISRTLGLRTVEIDRTRLAEGSRFCLRVNGQDVFCRGANVGPFDIIPARITDEHYRRIVDEARNANMNMLRINGCSLYESDTFYDSCDQAGILVWQDFLMTDSTYPEEDEAFSTLLEAETRAAVLRLRHHPSIALWCGNNECQQVFDIFYPDKSRPLPLGGQKFYNRVFPDLCRHLDPRRPYWPGSPCGGPIADSEISGDTHWWYTAFFNFKDMQRRIRHEVFDECRARFISEYGVIGPCHLDSIREYLAEEEMDPAHLAWKFHTNPCDNGSVSAGIQRLYSDPDALSVESLVLYGQMFQATMHGYAMEALRFRKNDPADDCQGALIWSYTDCWGETGWSILDHSLRRKASYYWFRRAAKPVKVLVRQRGARFVVRVVDDTRESFAGQVEAGWWRLDGSGKETERVAVVAWPDRLNEPAFAMEFVVAAKDPAHWVFAAVLYTEDGRPVDQSILPLLPYRDMDFPNTPIEVNDLGDGELEISSSGFIHAGHVEDHGRERISDNWFDLLPGVPVRIRKSDAEPLDEADFEGVRCRGRGASDGA